VQNNYGQRFYQVAASPVQTWRDMLAQKDVARALDAVHGHRLTEAFDRAIDTVASDAGALRAAVLQHVRASEARAATQATVACHQRALEVYTQHQGNLVGVVVRGLGQLADSHLGGLGLGNILASGASDAVQNTRLSGPLTDLSAALEAYDGVLKRCAGNLNDARLAPGGQPSARAPNLWALAAQAVAVGAGGAHFLWSRTTAHGVEPLATSSATTQAPTPTATTASAVPASPDIPAQVTNPKPRATVQAPRPASPPPAPAAAPAVAPVSRASCLQACIAKCNDDSNCERSCATGCHPK
jgi:cell division septation protein DedD